MAFKNIIIDFMLHSGMEITNPDQLAYAKSLINTAAKELYKEVESNQVFREQLFIFDSTQLQVALPYYVHKVRGLREFNTAVKLTLEAMMPRYSADGWNDSWSRVKWREKARAALAHDIENDGVLTFTLPDEAPEAFSVIIIGSNLKSSRIQEIVTFNIGDTQKTTVNSFINVETLRKNIPTTYDIIVTDLNENELAVFPNSEVESRYTILQISDYPLYEQTTDTQYIEVLYKTRFTPFVNDFDEFPAGSDYDIAIYWKTLEFWYARKEGKITESAASKQQAQTYKEQTDQEDQVSQEKKINFLPNSFYSLIRGRRWMYGWRGKKGNS